MSNPTIEYWSDQNGIVLRNSTIARQFDSITGSWSQLRIGLLLGMDTGSHADITGNPRFCVGLCSGSTNIFGDPVCGHFFGTVSGGTFTYNSSSAGIYYLSNVIGAIHRVSGSADVIESDFVGTAATYYANILTGSIWKGKSAWYVNFIKTPGTMSINLRYQTAVQTYGGTTTTSSFLRELASSSPGLAGVDGEGGALTNVSSNNFSVDESTQGVFDSVNIVWDRESPNPNLIIYAVGVAVIS